jgi:cellulose synthase/poly-beta-1,6-N-acetylglucosamine synthase-like glycosyltransferase
MGVEHVEGIPPVSVVVPVYNERQTICRCIEALLAQDYPQARYEILIVDNNSDDDTPDLVQRYPVTLLHERRVQTSYAARNRGILRAEGEIVAFTDADCIPRQDWLTHLTSGFVHQDVVGCAGRVRPLETTDAIGQFINQVHPLRSQEIGGLWYVITANAAYRRSALLAAGLFQEHLFTAGDIDMSLRLQLDGHGRIHFAPEAVVFHVYKETWGAMWRRFRRYGYSEVLMSSLYRDCEAYPIKTRDQVLRVLRQFRALITYGLSFIWRLRKVLRQGWVPDYNLTPALWATIESANVWGKAQALAAPKRATVKKESTEVKHIDIITAMPWPREPTAHGNRRREQIAFSKEERPHER